MSELGVEVIHAHSLAAKGRIERLFGTFQDRLVKELRPVRACTLAEANALVEDPIKTQTATVEDRLRGSLHLRHQQRWLRYRQVAHRLETFTGRETGASQGETLSPGGRSPLSRLLQKIEAAVHPQSSASAIL